MSTTVDERVVEMRFDNKQFEANVQTSLSTLEKLKQSLNLEGATKGLENVNATAKRFDMSGVSDAVETVKARFSALEVMGITALANITNSAVNAGKRMIESLTIAPISQGFDEYELKMGSIQTIMMSTGASLEEVNKYLNELNTYSDKTIYSFQDMTSNIGKFTNAGVGLEDAVMAIQGVSNVAAVSGANTNEASRAMYNFAQALSAGYVKLIDWKSIENANMATVEFKTQLLESAVACGTLTKTADGMYKTVKGNVIDATHGFNDSLQDQWMTTDALVGTLRQYADETTEIGKKAFAAAQDVKTFSQLMDTLKEAVGSGWAMTWEILFGDFEEAKVLWTSLSTTRPIPARPCRRAASEATEILMSKFSDKEFILLNRAKDLYIYTSEAVGNEKVIPRRRRYPTGQRLETMAMEILQKCHLANTTDLHRAFEERQRLQTEVIALCLTLEQLIDALKASKAYPGINQHKADIWIQHSLDVRYLCAAWRDRELERHLL